MPIQDAIKGTVDRRLQLKKGITNLDAQILRATTQRDTLVVELTKLDAGIDQLADVLKIPIDKNPEQAAIEAAALAAELKIPIDKDPKATAIAVAEATIVA
jgi:septal ring factor EnvC (AmiA/AmiB activator)